MKDKYEFCTEVVEDMKRTREKQRNSFFRLNVEISDNDAKAMQGLLKGFGITVDARKCSTCKQSWNFGFYF